MSSAISAADWLKSALDATAEFANGTLGYASKGDVQFSKAIPEGTRGAFVGLVSPKNSVQIGVMAANDGCERIARDLLGFEPDEELNHDDMVDAVGEIVNIVAGMMKTTLEKQDSSLKLGLPMFIDGRITPLEHQGTSVATLQFDGVGASVVVVYNDNA